MNNEVNIQGFLNMFNDRKSIMSGTGTVSKGTFLNEMNKLYKLAGTQNLGEEVIRCFETFYQENKGIINTEGIDPDLNVFLLTKDSDYKAIFGPQNTNIEETQLERTAEEPVNSLTNVKQRRLLNNKKGNHGLSTIAIIIEILTVALVIMMFLSLDI